MPVLLQINSVVNTGSTGRIAEQIGNYAISAGWESYIAYGRTKRQSQSVTIKIGKRYDIRFHGLQTRLFDRHGLGSARATKAFVKQIDEIKPDIVQLHNIHGYYLNYPILFDYLSKREMPVVWTLHDCWPFTGHCSYFSDINCTRWKSECHHCPKKRNYPASFWIENSRNNFRLKKQVFNSLKNMTIVPVSQWLGSMVEESILANYPMMVINNGIDTEAFSPTPDTTAIKKKYHLGDRFVLMGVATTWDRRKGWEDYMKLSSVLPDEYAIVLVGLSSKQKKLLPANITGIERIDSVKELTELYSAADVVLNLSYQETFGMTTIEGFACGTPGIVYNCTASPELITSDTGLIVEPGNIEQLIHAIELVRSNGKDFYLKNCRKRAVMHYDQEIRYNEYIQLYRRLIKTRAVHFS